MDKSVILIHVMGVNILSRTLEYVDHNFGEK